MRVCNLVFHIEGGAYAEGGWEWGTEEDVWAYEG
jgi:hypothetical protein